MDAPYQWTKQVASHWGGTRNGTIVHWPKGFQARGELRTQFHHVIDIAPTILEAAGLPHPVMVNGVLQQPLADDVWELYDTNADWTQASDLAARMPQKLAELQQLFMLEAGKYNVFP